MQTQILTLKVAVNLLLWIQTNIHYIYFIDVTGNTALQIALENGHIDCIQLVLNEKGFLL